MAQAFNANDVDESQALHPGSNNDVYKQSVGTDQGNGNASGSQDQTQEESTFSKVTTSIKEGTINASKIASEKSKERLSMEGQLKQARISLERYVNPKILNKQINEDTAIPKWVLKRAKGLVFLTVLKAGFLFAGNVGTGVVIVRKPNGGWTGPSSVGVGGVSFGFLAGASKIDYIMILPDDRAVKQFTGKGQLRLGGELQLAVGPIGRDGSGSVGAGDKGVSIIYSYSHAQGLYGGLALDGKVISVRPDCNKNFYKKSVDCAAILNGNIDIIPSNDDYDMIIHLLDSYCLDDDMTPIKGEKLSIDDLNKNDNQQDDEKKADKSDDVPLTRKISTGFSKLTSSVSQKILNLTQSKDDKGNQNDDVLLQKEVKPAQEKKHIVQSGNRPIQNNNNANYQIGDDDAPDYDDEQ